MKKIKILFIINPISGTGKQKSVKALIDKHIDRDKFEYSIVYTKAGGDATKISKEAIGENFNIIVAVGGDGSINEIARSIVNTNVSLGIIPTGSGNGLANHLHIPLKLIPAIKVINRNKTTNIDTASINKHLFVSIAGMGFDGLISKKYAKVNKRGFWPYFRLVTEEFQKYKPKTYKIFIDGKKTIVDALMINFANTDQFGYNTSIAPEAKINDGMIDVAILQKPPLIKIPYLVHLLYHKKIHHSKLMQLIKAKEVVVFQKKKRVVNVDGEAIKLGKRIKVRIKPASLKIIIP
ncbi:MAG: diacylglycerol kinase family lipid kinase [Bacteroidales bacterium]|nr:diacylglycerol kinase family lipid kinase [Bacteroidales bacterium]